MKAYRTIAISNALGDHLCATPLFRVLHKRGINVRVVAYRPRVLENNPNIAEFMGLDSKIKMVGKNLYKFCFENNAYMKLSEAWCEMYGEQLDEDRLEVYILKEIEDKAIEYLKSFTKPSLLIAPYGGAGIKAGKVAHMTKNKDWIKENWIKLIKILGKKYNIIQTGVSGEEIIKGVKNTLIDEDVMYVMAVLKNCKTFISVDTFLQHAANAVGQRGIVLFGRSDPYMFGHASNINLHSKCNMQECHKNNSVQAQWNIDLIQCKDRECIKNISVEDVLEAIEMTNK